jgi:hypothetical protein
MTKTETKKETVKCGLVMPISAIDGCGPDHWLEVKSIVSDSLVNFEKYDIQVNLVSDSNDSGVIHKRIVQNLYDSDIVICDVSCKNPNVMFELGMRLAFDKPAIIIKDDVTGYTFDAGVIEHLTYPRDLRFSKILNFKESLKTKVAHVLSQSAVGSNKNSFLKNFGTFNVAKIQTQEIGTNAEVVKLISDVQYEIANIRRHIVSREASVIRPRGSSMARLVERIRNLSKEIPECEKLLASGDPGFVSFLETHLAAEGLFSSRDEFKEFVTYQLARNAVPVTP